MGDKTAAAASFDKVTSQPRAGIAQLWKASLGTTPTGAAPTAG